MITDVVKAIKDTIQNEITTVHTAALGKVESYDAAEGTATVLPLATGYIAGRFVDYPRLYKVPVVMPRLGDISVTYPVKKDDVVLLVFCERSLNRWMESDVEEIGAFSFKNAIAIPGFAFGVTGNEADATTNRKVIVANGSTSIEVQPDKVVINGDLKVNGTIS